MKFLLTLLFAIVNVAVAKDATTFAVLRFNGKELVQTRLDPIVNPGKTSNHLHSVQGGSNFGASSTGEDLLKSNCSNAKLKADKSNYWTPTLFFNDPKTGKLEPVPHFYTNVYYFFEASDDPIKAFPVGLQMVSGEADRRLPITKTNQSNLDPSKGAVVPAHFTCPRKDYNIAGWVANSDGTQAGIGDPVNKGQGMGFPVVDCDAFASPLRADVHFPSCYNPKKGLTDYKNNMAWATDAGNGKVNCPSGYIHVPHLFFEVYWDTLNFKDRWTHDGKTQPFVLSNGDATGYSLHADFMAAWDTTALQHIIDTCNAGSAGMDLCPGVELNKEECYIKNTVDEQITGNMTMLPGKNAITGWKFGGVGKNGMVSSKGSSSSGSDSVSYSAYSASGSGSSSTSTVKNAAGTKTNTAAATAATAATADTADTAADVTAAKAASVNTVPTSALVAASALVGTTANTAANAATKVVTTVTSAGNVIVKTLQTTVTTTYYEDVYVTKREHHVHRRAAN